MNLSSSSPLVDRETRSVFLWRSAPQPVERVRPAHTATVYMQTAFIYVF